MIATAKRGCREEMDDPSRIPPTTSERQRRALTNPARARGRGRGRDRGRGDDIVLEEAPQILEEDVIDNGSGDDDDATNVDQVEEVLTGPFPGGPSDPSVLKSFKAHIVAAIWDQKERNPLRCYNHASKILEWRWWSRTDNRRFRDIVQQSSLSSLVHCMYRFVNRIVISAFVERWQPETNTFHLTVGEMTMTLDDVGTILGIPITGRSVSAATLTDQQAHALVVDALGVDDAEATEELSSARGQSVKLEWLQTKFSGCKDSDTEESIACAARAYLLFLLGCTLFSDKSGTRVPVVYLKLLMDLSDIHTYAWGAAALAYLYRQLGFATRSAVRQMTGYMTLLEAWIYEHFRPFRPRQNMQYTVQLPHVHRWTPRREAGSTISHLQALREELDRLAFDEVTWEPYRHCRQHHPCHEITFYTGCLKCLDVVEPYHPERVLRQFVLEEAPQILEEDVIDRLYEAGHDASVREPDRLYEAIERITRVLQGQQIDEAGPSSITLQTYNRRRRVDDR
ncbi:protein MAIN-LIKE 2-like [Camellia sinensis]|uniref:protein MAIN-LIKE 2-like n=1 Tax=Camellia sinensis TaxID=4442 RepID=UPI0010369741|nr:protein MAIN-LIKE 2-like [Camellia sinensis]